VLDQLALAEEALGPALTSGEMEGRRSLEDKEPVQEVDDMVAQGTARDTSSGAEEEVAVGVVSRTGAVESALVLSQRSHFEQKRWCHPLFCCKWMPSR
jgi:hypothetical protein